MKDCTLPCDGKSELTEFSSSISSTVLCKPVRAMLEVLRMNPFDGAPLSPVLAGAWFETSLVGTRSLPRPDVVRTNPALDAADSAHG